MKLNKKINKGVLMMNKSNLFLMIIVFLTGKLWGKIAKLKSFKKNTFNLKSKY